MGKSYKRGMVRPGPIMPDQPNMDAIEKSMNVAKVMSKAQKKKLVKAAKAKKNDGDGDDDDDDDDDAEADGKGKRKAGGGDDVDDEEEDKRLKKQKLKVKIAINDVPMKPASGKIKHHCPHNNAHKSQTQCISAGCANICRTCSSVVSRYGGSSCRECENKAKIEARNLAKKKKEDEKAAKFKEEEARKETENVKRKPAGKWPDYKKEEQLKQANEAQDAAFKKRKEKTEEEAQAKAKAKMVTTAGIKKNIGHFGSKAKKAKKSRRKFWSGMSEDDILTVKVAMLLYRHCQDLIWKF